MAVTGPWSMSSSPRSESMARSIASAIALQLASAKIRLMQFDPLARNPAFILEHAQLRVGAVEMNEPREQQRQRGFPSSVCRVRYGCLQSCLIGKREALADFPQHLPNA